MAFLPELGEVGQFAFGHELLGQFGSEAVQTDDNDLVHLAFFIGFLAFDQTKKKTEWPG